MKKQEANKEVEKEEWISGQTCDLAINLIILDGNSNQWGERTEKLKFTSK